MIIYILAAVLDIYIIRLCESYMQVLTVNKRSLLLQASSLLGNSPCCSKYVLSITTIEYDILADKFVMAWAASVLEHSEATFLWKIVI